MRLRLGRCIWLALVVAAMALVTATPAGAVTAGEESESPSTPGETTTESPSGPAEPAASSPGSTGWTPVEPGTGTSNDGASPIRRGSSLGSGAGTNSSTDSEPVESTGEEPAYTAPPAESSTPSTFEAGAGTRQAESTTRPPAPPAPIAKAVDVGVGTAAPVTAPESDQGGTERSASPPLAAALTNSEEQGGSGSNALLLLAAIVIGLSLAFAGWRMGLDLWQRRAQRQHIAVRRSREADWEAFLHRIERTQALGTSNPSGEQLHRAERGSESAPLKVRANGSAGQDRARTPAKTG